LSSSFFRIAGASPKALNWFPKTGNDTDTHLSNILSIGVLTMAVEDRPTGKLLATCEQVKAANNNWSMGARGLVGNDMSWNAIRIKDESEIT
jgi:hypothetical protein